MHSLSPGFLYGFSGHIKALNFYMVKNSFECPITVLKVFRGFMQESYSFTFHMLVLTYLEFTYVV